MKAKASCINSPCSVGAAARSTVQLSAFGTRPAVDTKSKYASTVPANASAMPTEQIKRYFHEASTEDFVRCSGITTAEVMVVASMVTHMNPTLLVVTATSIIRAKALTKMRKRLACPSSYSSASPRPGPNADASSVTVAIESARSADRPSTRQKPSLETIDRKSTRLNS